MVAVLHAQRAPSIKGLLPLSASPAWKDTPMDLWVPQARTSVRQSRRNQLPNRLRKNRRQELLLTKQLPQLQPQQSRLQLIRFPAQCPVVLRESWQQNSSGPNARRWKPLLVHRQANRSTVGILTMC